MRMGLTFPTGVPITSPTSASADIPGINPIPATPPAIADSLRKFLRFVGIHSLRLVSDDLKYSRELLVERFGTRSIPGLGLDTRGAKILFQGRSRISHKILT